MNENEEKVHDARLAYIIQHPDIVRKAHQQALDEERLDRIGSIYGTFPDSLESIMTEEYSDDIWQIHGLLPSSGITVMSAQPGSYKTWLLLEVARCVASGSKLFGEFETKQTAVLVVDEENGKRLLQQRLKLLGVDKELPIKFLTYSGFKFNEDSVAEILEYCQTWDIGLVTFDSLVRVHGANENDAKEMAEVFNAIRALANEGVTVLLTHHNRKPSNGASVSAHDMRGSSDILAALDCHIALTRPEQRTLMLTQTKVRLAEELPKIELQIVTDEESLRFEYVGMAKPDDSKREIAEAAIFIALEAKSDGLNQRQLLEILERMDSKVNARTLRDILKKMISKGLISEERGYKNSVIYKIIEKTDEVE